MAAVCYSVPISAIPITDQLFEAISTRSRLQINITKTEKIARVYTDGLTDGSTDGHS